MERTPGSCVACNAPAEIWEELIAPVQSQYLVWWVLLLCLGREINITKADGSSQTLPVSKLVWEKVGEARSALPSPAQARELR